MRDEELVFDHTGAVDVEATIDQRRWRGYEPTQYVPPPSDVEMWRIFRIINMLKITGTEKAVLSCLVDHANPKTGQCDPGQGRLATLLELPRRTVQRAIANLLKSPYLRSDRRGRQTSNAYHVQWGAILAAEEQYQTRQRRRITSDTDGASVATETAHKKEKVKGKDKRKPERDDLPKGKCVHGFENQSSENQERDNELQSEPRVREEVFRGSVVQPPCKPTEAVTGDRRAWWQDRLERAEAALAKADTPKNRDDVARLRAKLGELEGREEAA